MHKHSMPRIVIAMLLVLLAGMVTPLLWPLAMTQAIYFLPVLLCFITVWAGPVPGAAMSAAILLSSIMSGGAAMGAGLAALVVVPAAANHWTLERRLPFFKALKIALAVQLGCTLLIAAGLYLYTRMDLVDIMTENLRLAINALPVATQNQIIQTFARMGMVGDNYRTLQPLLITESQRVILFDRVAALLNESLRLSLPGDALCGSVIGALLTVTLPRYWCARRGLEPQVNYVPLTQWRVPLDVVAGIAGCLVVAYIVERAGLMAVAGASATLLALLMAALQIHGGAALVRMLKQNGVKHRMRMLLLAIGLMPGMFILYLGGVYSLLFGSHGAIPIIQKRMRNKEGDDK